MPNPISLGIKTLCAKMIFGGLNGVKEKGYNFRLKKGYKGEKPINLVV